MKNPLFNNRTSPNQETAPNDPINDSYKRYKRGYNKFNLGRPHKTTERFADINVVDVFEGVEGDKFTIANKHHIRSYTWKSPKEFDIFKKLSYYFIDMSAILPKNWEKIYKQPNKGDDVDISVNSVSKRILYNFNKALEAIRTFAVTEDYYKSEVATHYFKFVLLMESIFSDGSILAKMNCHLSKLIEWKGKSFDSWCNYFYSDVLENCSIYIEQFGSSFAVRNPEGTNRYAIVSKHWLLNYMRSHNDWRIREFGQENAPEFEYISFEDIVSNIFSKISEIRYVNYGNNYNYLEEDYWLNFSRLIAYQLVCVQFYCRDSVDDIYTAQLWHENQLSLIETLRTTGAFIDTFSYNGVRTNYDATSGFLFDQMFNHFFQYIDGQFNTSINREEYFNACYAYLTNIFYCQQSLRYGDYFNGAKTLPYAPADVTAEVSNSGVSALDITRSILMQRFANAVERVSNTWNDYLRGVTDGIAPPNKFEPRWLHSVTSKVSGFEVENTAESQFTNNNITTMLKSGDSQYIYEVEVGEPCIILGLSTYSAVMDYSRTTERFWHHKDRFEMFNKFMQNIGDQSITQFERSPLFKPTLAYGYTPRHMEYKKRYPIVSGGFVENLPGYAFVADNDNSGQDAQYLTSYEISPELIRNNNSELDRYYASLTGYSLSSYFHFIVSYQCFVTAYRQMEYSPSIL